MSFELGTINRTLTLSAHRSTLAAMGWESTDARRLAGET
jgi:hypothetical protein